MHILHIVESLDPTQGGPAVCAPSLACAQTARGDRATLLYYGMTVTANEDKPAHIVSLPGISSVEFFPLPAPDRLERLLALQARTWLQQQLANYDIIHLHGVWRPILAVAAATADAQGIPYVIQPHGMLDAWSMRQKRMKKRLAWHFRWQHIANRSAFVHVLNHTEAVGVHDLGTQAPQAIVGNGIFRQQLEKLERNLSPTVDEPYILFLSRLHPKKGLDILAEAYRLYRLQGGTARLRVVGPDEGAASIFRRDIDRANITKYVDVEPPIYSDEKYALMQGAACFCLPSYQEGFSVALLEAAACGVPLVISTQCHFPEVETEGAGHVVPLDSQAFADALRYFTTTDAEDRCKQAGQRGRALVRERFTWEIVAEQLDTHYRQALTRAAALAL